ncbi:MAG: GNAT family N-acetyltransferase [Gammaproteobacteria bacterium]
MTNTIVAQSAQAGAEGDTTGPSAPGDTGEASEASEASIIEFSINERVFGIRAADIDEQRNSASLLINKMYAWRGYAGSHQLAHDPNRITLTASDAGEVIGTVSMGLDGSVGLLADQVFKDCIEPYRQAGKVCEIIKLAIDPTVKSKAVLAALFHVVFIYAYKLHSCTDIFAEVNPRHRRFYETMLGFKVECESRPNPRVEAPAVLLRISSDYAVEQIARFAGHGADAGTERSLYPHFFSKREESGIITRLMQIG